MAKLMEIIEKVPNFRDGTVSMKMLDTTFSQLTRKIGTEVGADYKTATTGQLLSKELLQSLNKDQIALKDRLEAWKQAYNVYIDSIKPIITEAVNFNYNFSSAIDYTSKYEAGKTLADYYLLTEVVNAEKELYEFINYWGKNHMTDLLNKMKEWSKTRVYGSSLKEIKVSYHTSGGGSFTCYNNGGFEMRRGSYEEAYYFSGFEKMKINESRNIKFSGSFSNPNNTWRYYCDLTITRKSLGNVPNDDGYYIFSWKRSGEVQYDNTSGPYISKWSGISSPHFDIDLKLNNLKKLNLNVPTLS